MTAVALFLPALVSCDGDLATQGSRGPCASAGGNTLLCDDRAIESAEDACWKLVDCAVMPLLVHEGNGLDWQRCVDLIDGLADFRYQHALRCIEASSCDDLKRQNSPTNPPRTLPVCAQFGD